jgi:hypothetical protein
MRTVAIVLGLGLLCISSANVFGQECGDKLTSESPARDVIACIKEQQNTIKALKKGLSEGDPGPALAGNNVGGGVPQTPTKCPAGYYASGINWWGSPDSTRYCIGCLSGIQVLCSKLNVQ